MNFLNLNLDIKNLPELDKNFIPCAAFFKAYSKEAKNPVSIAVERSNGEISVFNTNTYNTEDMKDADILYLDRLIKFLLWSRGGFKVFICGECNVGEEIKQRYTENGTRAFDKGFMERVYEQEFSIELCTLEECPKQVENPKQLGGHLKGCRIGFDAGGSDRKVSAVIDGESVYNEEVVWFPKINSDPDYHYAGIVEAMKTAASKMPRVDAIGVSSAGVFVNDRCMVASLFNEVPMDLFNAKAKDIYLRAVKEIGEDIPVSVCNDGDVTALAGAQGMGDNGVLGIAMGTSEAVGYVNSEGCITGWLNELAFAPVDCYENAAEDEWSGDIGCGVKYMSQDSIILLAGRAGLELKGTSPAEKLKEVQEMMKQQLPVAYSIYRSLGVYLGHSLGFYSSFYDIKHAMLLGRVMSGEGGDIIMSEAQRVLKEEYPQCDFEVCVPDEKTRRVGQSVVAASLPQA